MEQASTLATFKSRAAAMTRADVCVVVSFFLFGLINNVLYVIILSAALDLVGINIPKGVVLLADVVPSFLLKLVAPYFIAKVSYGVRIVAFVVLSASGMLIIGLSPAGQDHVSVITKLIGIALASVSSGGGELSFLALTHFYGQQSLAAWSAGTGGAGLLGAWLYVLATSTFGISSSATLLACSLFPVFMLLSYFLLLPARQEPKSHGYQAVDDADEDNEDVRDQQADPVYEHPSALGATGDDKKVTKSLRENLGHAKALLIPYMLPLFLVYVAEYTINQGIAPTLLFPLATTPFHAFREFYPVYNALYQVGVFVSRSSISFVRIRSLYLPSMLQILNLVLLTLHAMFDFIPSVWIVFGIIFWEGLLGGTVYVNTFAQIRDNVPEESREFSLATATVSDSGGIMVAAVLGMAFEKGLCGWQASHGRDYCRIT